jgi:hypothetical protein
LLLYSSHLPLGVPNGQVIYFINSVASTPYAGQATPYASHVIFYAALPQAGHVASYIASSYGAPPGANLYAAPSHAGYAAPYGATTYSAPYGVAPQGIAAYGTASYTAPPASTQTWDPSLSMEWVFDSGATTHLSKVAGILYSLSPHPIHRHVTVGDGSSVPAHTLAMPLFLLFYLIVHFIFVMFLLHLT